MRGSEGQAPHGSGIGELIGPTKQTDPWHPSPPGPPSPGASLRFSTKLLACGAQACQQLAHFAGGVGVALTAGFFDSVAQDGAGF